MIKVSIIIPVYNGSEYIEECIKGIQRQTLKDIEVLCVDDGSTDNSLLELERIQKSDERIHIFIQANQGAGIARNLALKNAVGEFVCFLDVDDYFLANEALEKLYCAAVEQKVLVCGGQFYLNLKNEIKKVSVYRNLWSDSDHGKMLKYVDYQQDFYFSGYLYFRQMLQQQDITFPAYRSFEDPPFCVKALSAAEKIYVTDIPFYCYRVGYKERVYDEQMACDQIRGMTDNLHFSRIKTLKRLHQITYYRMINSCRRELKIYCQKGSEQFLDLLKKAEKEICWEWLEEKCSICERSLKAFWEISVNDRNCSEEWNFPYGELKKGSRVVLYGAGEVGRSYYRQICNDECILLCMWVDENFSQINDIDGIEIISPECLSNSSFDYVVIAVANMMAAIEIMDLLGSKGIAADRIVWNIGR